MTRSEKKEAVENMAERYMSIESAVGKSVAALWMSAYIEGRAAGKEEERRKWEHGQAAAG